MKILILQDDFPPKSFGGAENIVFNLVKKLKKRGEDVLVVTTTQNKNEEGKIEYEGLKIHRIYSDYHSRWRAYISLYNPYVIQKVKKIISDFNPDVIHANNIHYHISYSALKIAKNSGVKVILTTHDAMLFHYWKFTEYINPKDTACDLNFNYKISPWTQLKVHKRRYNPFRNIIIRYYLRYCDNIYAVSNELKKALEQNKIKNVEVIHNGIDTNIWTPQVAVKGLSSWNKVDGGETLKSNFNLTDKKIVLQVGKSGWRKGSVQIIKIMNTVKDFIPQSVLVIASKRDAYEEEMRRIADKFGVEIVFTGWLDESDLRAMYSISDVVVFPSVCFDTFGMVNIEAMAMEKPVVATCFGGSREIVEDGVTGYIRNPYDTNSFAQAIIGLLEFPEKAREFGKNGRMRVVNNFTLEKQVEKYMSIYEN
ncbi:MAG: glycosyltransferase family 4 protein [Patescibacteria group bacterium]